MEEKIVHIKCPYCGELIECYYEYKHSVSKYGQRINYRDFPIGRMIYRSDIDSRRQFITCTNSNCQEDIRVKHEYIIEKGS